MVNCDNIFCIYEEDGICLLEKIEINSKGNCAYFRHTVIDDEILEQSKADLREYGASNLFY